MKDDTEKKYLIIEDCKNRVLSNDVWEASDDYSLFHITPVRSVREKALFADCAFLNVFIDHRTTWGAPIPSTFELFFEDLLRLVVPESYPVLLNVVDPYEGYFEEQHFIKTFVEPNNLFHFSLDKQIGERKVSTLVFECPLDKLTILNEVAFPGTVIDVEGFVMKDPTAELFEKWSRQGNTDAMFRDLIRNVHFAFHMWRDFNGLFTVTDKFDIAGLAKVVDQSSLDKRIAEYVANYGNDAK